MMRYALFLGCTIPVRSAHYEISARKVLEKLGVETLDNPDFSCCGFPMRSIDAECSDLMAARNIALASTQKVGICTLCSACTAVLTETERRMRECPDVRESINAKLSRLGKSYDEEVKIRHFSRLLYDDIGISAIESRLSRSLSPLNVAVHYGCHYLKPSEIYDHVEDPELPHSIDEIIQCTGASTVDYENKTRCCGGALLGIDESMALSIAQKKLEILKARKVHAMVLVCPFCSIMYEDNQKKIENRFESTYEIPILFLSQLLGLALGIDPKELGVKMNKVSVQKVLDRLI